MKDVRGVVVVEKDGQMHTQTDEGHFYSPPLPMLGENE